MMLCYHIFQFRGTRYALHLHNIYLYVFVCVHALSFNSYPVNIMFELFQKFFAWLVSWVLSLFGYSDTPSEPEALKGEEETPSEEASNATLKNE